jgi:hypothetical protein
VSAPLPADAEAPVNGDTAGVGDVEEPEVEEPEVEEPEEPEVEEPVTAGDGARQTDAAARRDARRKRRRTRPHGRAR